jgi:hypothetical protein
LVRFSWNLLFGKLSKICRENSTFIKIWLELRVLHIKTNRHFSSYLAQFFLEWKIFQISFVEKIETPISYSIFFFENRNLYEITWKNIVEWGRTKMTIWSMRIACCVIKATNTHLFCVIFIAFPQQRNSMLRYTNTDCLLVIKRYHELNVVYKMLNCTFITAQFLMTLSHILQHCRKMDINISSWGFLIKFHKWRVRDTYACIFSAKTHLNDSE